MVFPERLGRLRRVRALGVGGFASVWLYHDEELDSPVAVKSLAENWASDPGIRNRFLDEARLLRQARSEHLVRVHDIGTTEDGIPWFVMSYADAGSVADLLDAEHPPTPSEITDIVSQAARGLAALHAEQVVHRDIKPGNLLLTQRADGRRRVMVADLGVAKSLTVDTGATMAVGTPSYAAPEQDLPDVVPDVRADVHGLGAVAYALMTGKAPRAGLMPGAPVPPLRTLAPSVPETLERVVMTALEPDREHRWPDVTSFATAFEAAARGRTVPVPFPAAPAPPAPARPGWLIPVIAVGTVLALVLVGGLVWFFAGRGGQENRFMAAGREYLETLQADDCQERMESPDLLAPPKDPAEACSGLHWEIAQCMDLSKKWRVEAIGEDRARVIVIRQGYVEMVRNKDGRYEAGYMATGFDSVCPDGL